MPSDVLMMLVFLAIGVIFILQGLPGFLSGEMYIRGKYGRGTRYTGNKAVAMGFGTIALGLLIILNGIFVVTGNVSTKSPLMMAGFIMGIVVYLLSWIVSWFVSGTAVRERRSWSWW